MKEAAKLLAYLVAVLLLGAILAPFLYWGAHVCAEHGIATFLLRYNFETYFHRALLIAAAIFAWPLLQTLKVHSLRDVNLQPDRYAVPHLFGGWLIAVIPLACAAIVLIAMRVFLLKTVVPWPDLAKVVAAAIAVPLIEEAFFRGLLLGLLLRATNRAAAVLITSGFFALLHFLKAPPAVEQRVTWYTGFLSIARAFASFGDPLLVLSAFSLLFLLGLMLADARLRTRSLWLPIGLHSGWIFVSGAVNKMTRRQWVMLPWLGSNLLVGLLPLALALITWLGLIVWLKYAHCENV